jgi:hypothetical protein
MLFSIEKIIAGKWLQRKEWAGNAVLLHETTIPEKTNLLTGEVKDAKTIKQIVMINLVSGDTSPYMMGAPDLLSDDWQEYIPPKKEKK